MSFSQHRRVMVDIPRQYRLSYRAKRLDGSEDCPLVPSKSLRAHQDPKYAPMLIPPTPRTPVHDMTIDNTHMYLPSMQYPFVGSSTLSRGNSTLRKAGYLFNESPIGNPQDDGEDTLRGQFASIPDIKSYYPGTEPAPKWQNQNKDVRFFSITGTAFPKCNSISDIFRPQHYVHEPKSIVCDPSVDLDSLREVPKTEHLEVTKAWKGLSTYRAEELVFWEQAFRYVLGDLLQHKLDFLQDYFRQDGQLGPGCQGFWADEWSTPRYLPLSIVDFTMAMVHYSKKHTHSHRWFASTGNIYKTVAQFIRTHNCFISDGNAIDHLLVGVSVRKPVQPVKAFSIGPAEPIAEIDWNPDFISFTKLESTVVEGEEFQLNPRYNYPSWAPINSNDVLQRHVIFTTSATWLHWNPRSSGFAGIVPFFSDAQESFLHPGQIIIPSVPQHPEDPYTIRLVVKMTATEYFGDNVRFEQTARARINLRVIQRSSFVPNTPLNDYIKVMKAEGRGCEFGTSYISVGRLKANPLADEGIRRELDPESGISLSPIKDRSSSNLPVRNKWNPCPTATRWSSVTCDDFPPSKSQSPDLYISPPQPSTEVCLTEINGPNVQTGECRVSESREDNSEKSNHSQRNGLGRKFSRTSSPASPSQPHCGLTNGNTAQTTCKHFTLPPQVKSILSCSLLGAGSKSPQNLPRVEKSECFSSIGVPSCQNDTNLCQSTGKALPSLMQCTPFVNMVLVSPGAYPHPEEDPDDVELGSPSHDTDNCDANSSCAMTSNCDVNSNSDQQAGASLSPPHPNLNRLLPFPPTFSSTETEESNEFPLTTYREESEESEKEPLQELGEADLEANRLLDSIQFPPTLQSYEGFFDNVDSSVASNDDTDYDGDNDEVYEDSQDDSEGVTLSPKGW